MESNVASHESFIVRVHLEPAEDDTERWLLRGQVEHVSTGQSWRFTNAVELARILDAYLHGQRAARQTEQV